MTILDANKEHLADVFRSRDENIEAVSSPTLAVGFSDFDLSDAISDCFWPASNLHDVKYAFSFCRHCMYAFQSLMQIQDTCYMDCANI